MIFGCVSKILCGTRLGEFDCVVHQLAVHEYYDVVFCAHELLLHSIKVCADCLQALSIAVFPWVDGHAVDLLSLTSLTVPCYPWHMPKYSCSI